MIRYSHIFGILDIRQGQLGQSGEVHFLDDYPVGADGDGRVSALDRGLVLLVPHALRLAVLAHHVLAVLLLGPGALAQHLELVLHAAHATAAPHVALVAHEAASLVRRLLDAGRVHQVERALVLVVVVSILAASDKLGLVFTWTNTHTITN